MGWITGLFSLIRAIPDLLKIAKEVFKFLHQIKDYFERAKKTKEFKEAIVTANQTGNTSKLDQLFNGGSGAPTPKP